MPLLQVQVPPQPLAKTSLRAGSTTTQAFYPSHASPADVGTQTTVHEPNVAVSRAPSTIERSPVGSSINFCLLSRNFDAPHALQASPQPRAHLLASVPQQPGCLLLVSRGNASPLLVYLRPGSCFRPLTVGFSSGTAGPEKNSRIHPQKPLWHSSNGI